MPGKQVQLVEYSKKSLLAGDEIEFHWWDTTPTSLHRHNHYEFFIITHGKARHTLNNKSETLGQNTLCMLRPQDCHQFEPVEGRRCIHMNLALTPQKLAAFCALLNIDEKQLLQEGESYKVVLANEDLEFFTTRAGQLGLLASEGQAKTTPRRVILAEMVTQALATLYKRRNLPGQNYPEWFSHLLQTIHSPEFLGCSAEDVYALSGYSPPAIIRHFKRYTGKTIAAYLAGVKVDYACTLFATTGAGTLEVAGRLGYDSLSHFNRLFKQHTGKTPSEYRKAAQKQTPLLHVE